MMAGRTTMAEILFANEQRQKREAFRENVMAVLRGDGLLPISEERHVWLTAFASTFATEAVHLIHVNGTPEEFAEACRTIADYAVQAFRSLKPKEV
jgi:hypothetical protein